METVKEIGGRRIRFTIRRKIISLAICVILPFVLLLGYLLHFLQKILFL